MLFREAAERYIADKSARLRASTVEGYRSALDRHVLPRWGACELADIDPAGIQSWVDSFEMPGAAEKAYKTLRQVIRWAIRRLGVRMWDPTAAGVELPRREPYRPRTLGAGELRDALRALWGHELEAVAICAAALGLRRGEAMGLKWSDIDMRTGEVRVRRSRQVVGGEEAVVPPKTDRAARSLWLPAFALRRLRALRKGRSGWLCPDRPDRAARRLGSALRAAGVPWVPMTCLRHTWATLAVEAGVGIEAVALMLGHAGITTAYEHYIVPRKTVCREAQSKVEALLMRA